MKKDIFWKKYLTFVFAAILLFTTLAGALPINGEQGLYDKILRLHVVANSDSECDQALKLKVRDSVLFALSEIYAENGVESKEQADKAISENLDALKAAALDTIAQAGAECAVEAVICKEYYPTKRYQNITLPAGEYTSLQIKLGKAQGKNWWCVLFPTLCLASATVHDAPASYVYSENGEEFISAGFTPAELRIITESDQPDVKIKFKILEIFESIKAE